MMIHFQKNMPLLASIATCSKMDVTRTIRVAHRLLAQKREPLAVLVGCYKNVGNLVFP
jgi:hypothetical protein